MTSFTYDADEENATVALGAALAAALPEGAIVALCGTLGAGKTRLVQAIAEATGIDRREVVSPTFMLIQEYAGHSVVYHVDAYRIRDADEFLALGPDEVFESGALVLIEWADKVEDCLPRERIEIHIEVTGRQSRRFEITAIGQRYAEVVASLTKTLPAAQPHRRRSGSAQRPDAARPPAT